MFFWLGLGLQAISPSTRVRGALPDILACNASGTNSTYAPCTNSYVAIIFHRFKCQKFAVKNKTSMEFFNERKIFDFFQSILCKIQKFFIIYANQNYKKYEFKHVIISLVNAIFEFFVNSKRETVFSFAGSKSFRFFH